MELKMRKSRWFNPDKPTPPQTYTSDRVLAWDLIRSGYYPAQPESRNSDLIDIGFLLESEDGCQRLRSEIDRLTKRGSQYADHKWRISHRDVVGGLTRLISRIDKYGLEVATSLFV